eukprot:GCRY01002365.1.p1 GENE.GCRY01002365.1~~GCRY01002365.1.p1  ORF type:complete len:311 (+),score=48.91 GCRY01002365.1:128-934(+)
MTNVFQNTKILVGNWYESEREREEQLQDYLEKKKKGLLLSQQLGVSFEPVPLTSHEDGLLHYGDTFILHSEHTTESLAVDLGESSHGTLFEAYAVTTAKIGAAIPRNTFTIQRVEHFDYEDESDIVRFEEPFYISSMPSLCEKKLYLASRRANGEFVSKYSRKQEVYMTPTLDVDCKWRLSCLDPEWRLEMELQPVESNVPVMLVHIGTGQPLGSSGLKHENDFGTEHEVNCFQYTNQRKGGGQRNITAENAWVFVAPSPPTPSPHTE